MTPRRSFALLIAVVAPSALAGAQTPARTAVPAPAAAAALPPAKDVIARYVAAIGGRDAVMRHSSYRATGTFEMPTAGIKGDLELVHAKPNKMALKMMIPGLGEILTGFDGTVGWSVDPMQGPRLLEGKELEQLSSEADFANMVRAASNITSRETVERTDLGGQPCYKVKVVWKSGRETFDCYSTETGLLVAELRTQESPMGAMDVTSLLSDYKDFGGVKIATRNRVQTAMGQEQVLTLTDFTFDAVPPTAFERPAAIQALVKQGAAKP